MTQTIINVPAAFDPTDITLTDNTSGAFLIKEGTNEYMRINTTNGAALTEFNVPANDGAGFTINLPADSGSNTGFQCTVPGGAGHLKFGRQATGIYTGGTAFLASAGNASLNIMGNQFLLVSSSPDIVMNLNASSVDFKVTDAADATILEVKEDSSLTHTLDDGSGATFKVTDNGASPKLFFSATEGGNTFVRSDSSTFLDGGGALYLRIGNSDRIRADGGALYLGGSGKLNIIDTGTPLYNKSPNLLDLGATTGTTVLNIQSDGAFKKIKCNPSTVSQTFTIEFQDGASTNRDYVIEQHFAIHNDGTENCTIQATVTSGRGSALGKDLSAGGSTSGELVAGMTLNAGKSALFKAVKWNKELAGALPTAADNQFMFQTIMVEA